MIRLLPLLIPLFLILSGGGPSAAGDAHPWDNKRVYYIIEYQGRLREKGIFVRRPGSFQKRQCVIFEEEKHSYAEHDPNLLILSVRIKTITTPDGVAIQRQEETHFGEPGRELIAVSGGEADFAASGFFGRSIRVPAPQGSVFEVSGEWLSARKPQTGKTTTVDIIDRVARRAAREQVRFTERLSAGDDSTPAVWMAVFTSEGRPPLYARFTSDGRLLRLDSEGLTYQVVGYDDFVRGGIPSGMEPPIDAAREPPADGGGEGEPAIAITDPLPVWDSFAWITLQATPPGEWQNRLPASDYAQIEPAGDSIGVTSLRNAPRVDADAALPMRIPPEIQPYAAASGLLPSTHPTIIERARAAVREAGGRRPETNALRAVSYIAGWINQTVAVTKWDGAAATALQALSGRSADSVGHARLFAAMARSQGIPVRLCQGFLTLGGRAAYHCWAEAWIDGVWVPVDTTVSRVGLPAGYVLVEYAAPDGIFRAGFADFMRAPDLRLRLVSAGRETPSRRQAELTVGDKRTYAASEGDWMANLYWGFALRLPHGWRGEAKLDRVEAASPDRLASIACEALAGDFQADKPELDSTLASLRGSLERFRPLESRIISFDRDGAAPALFIDFTCLQNGVSLRCRQYLVPRRERAFRLSFWAPSERFADYAEAFEAALTSFEY